MAEQTPAVDMQRKLAAIFSTDVAGYSRLMDNDEEVTIRALTTYRTLIASLIQQYRARASMRLAIFSWRSLPAWWVPCAMP